MIEWTHEAAAHYLAAMIDGEGHVAHRLKAPGSRDRHITITNTDVDIIAATLEACQVIGLTRVTIRIEAYHHKTPIYVMRIAGRDQLKRIRDVVPLQSVKRHTLREALASYTHLNKAIGGAT